VRALRCVCRLYVYNLRVAVGKRARTPDVSAGSPLQQTPKVTASHIARRRKPTTPAASLQPKTQRSQILLSLYRRCMVLRLTKAQFHIIASPASALLLSILHHLSHTASHWTFARERQHKCRTYVANRANTLGAFLAGSSRLFSLD
jgi:hypothetical protein